MDRGHIQALIAERRRDAEALLRQHRWGFAYSATGYVVELGLKSCVLTRMIHTGWVFAGKLPVKSFMTHDFQELVQLSRLDKELAAELATNKAFARNWGNVLRWKETVRYDWADKTRSDAEELYKAVADEPDGVQAWLRRYW
jgi:hypothetical protein